MPPGESLVCSLDSHLFRFPTTTGVVCWFCPSAQGDSSQQERILIADPTYPGEPSEAVCFPVIKLKCLPEPTKIIVETINKPHNRVLTIRYQISEKNDNVLYVRFKNTEGYSDILLTQKKNVNSIIKVWFPAGFPDTAVLSVTSEAQHQVVNPLKAPPPTNLTKKKKAD